MLVGIMGDRKPLAKLALANPRVVTLWDRNGELSNAYGVAVCPTLVVVDHSGVVRGTVIGTDSNRPAWLAHRITTLLAGEPASSK